MIEFSSYPSLNAILRFIFQNCIYKRFPDNLKKL